MYSKPNTAQSEFQPMPQSAPATKQPTPGEIQDAKDKSLCFWLGFFLPVYGLIIAAIIRKGDGVRSALVGFVFSLVIYALIAFLVVLNIIGD